MNINLVFGFLGSGKTTLVKRLVADQANDNVAVIVNEFGDVGIDGLLLKGNSVDIVQLNSGCLCCNLKGPMVDAIAEINASGHVKTLFIESSGVAEPVDTLKALIDPALTTTVTIGPIVTVINLPHFEKLRDALGDFYTDQVKNADVILLNKVDLMESDEALIQGKLVRELNPYADFLYSSHCDVSLADLFESSSRKETDFVARIKGLKRGTIHEHDHMHNKMDSLVASNSQNISRSQIIDWFTNLPCQVYRAKGFAIVDGVQSILHYSFGQLEIEPSTATNKNQMIFIGQNLLHSELTTGYERLKLTDL
ncbi:MAG: hypothetical protein CL398_03045 [Acidiferrobacteraceae bacterium]|nr:hypothetical protein [Acidiferrobacteraceae bacterium]